MSSRGWPWRDIAGTTVLLASKIAAGLHARGLGFTHVSDDDYARVTIAQAFAHAPKLDPSGTSWLPFPFWLVGSAMRLVDRSLATAEAIAWALGALAPICVYFAAKRTLDPRAALAGAWLFALTPWGIWLGTATVPEVPTAALAAVGVFLLGARRLTVRAAWIGGTCALAAALSRYEAWPIAAVLAIWCVGRMREPDERRPRAIAMVLLAAGPVAWMAWNHRAHGDPLHFFHRVSTFHARAGDGGGIAERLGLYPVALAREAPEMAILGVASLAAMASSELRRRTAVVVAAVFSVLVFLAWGSLSDGAPTHHAVRALVIVFPLVAIAGADTALHVYSTYLRGDARRWAGRGAALVLALGFLWCANAALAHPPGASPAEDRTAQLGRGKELARTTRARRVEVTPCAYEHFALIAAFASPERVTASPPRGVPVTPSCPDVALVP